MYKIQTEILLLDDQDFNGLSRTMSDMKPDVLIEAAHTSIVYYQNQCIKNYYGGIDKNGRAIFTSYKKNDEWQRKN